MDPVLEKYIHYSCPPLYGLVSILVSKNNKWISYVRVLLKLLKWARDFSPLFQKNDCYQLSKHITWINSINPFKICKIPHISLSPQIYCTTITFLLLDWYLGKTLHRLSVGRVVLEIFKNPTLEMEGGQFWVMLLMLPLPSKNFCRERTHLFSCI